MSLLPLSQRTVCKADPINDTVVLGERKTFGVRRDMLTVTADDGRGGGAGHQAGAGFEHRIDLLAHHQAAFAIRLAVAGGKLCQPKMDDFTGLERQHRAGEPWEARTGRFEKIVRAHGPARCLRIKGTPNSVAL